MKNKPSPHIWNCRCTIKPINLDRPNMFEFGSMLHSLIPLVDPKVVVYIFWDTIEIRLQDSLFQNPELILTIKDSLDRIRPIGMDLKIKPLSYQQSYTTGIILLNVNRPYLGEIKP